MSPATTPASTSPVPPVASAADPVVFVHVRCPSLTTVPAPLSTTMHPNRCARRSHADARPVGSVASPWTFNDSARRLYSPGCGVRTAAAWKSRCSAAVWARQLIASASTTTGTSSCCTARSDAAFDPSLTPMPGPTRRQSHAWAQASIAVLATCGAISPPTDSTPTPVADGAIVRASLMIESGATMRARPAPARSAATAASAGAPIMHVWPEAHPP